MAKNIFKVSIFEYEYYNHLNIYADYRNRYKTCKGCNETFINTDRYFKVVNKKLTNICNECFPDYDLKENVEKRIKENYCINQKRRQYRQKREGRKKSVKSNLTYDEWIKCLEYFESKCAYCGIYDYDLL